MDAITNAFKCCIAEKKEDYDPGELMTRPSTFHLEEDQEETAATETAPAAEEAKAAPAPAPVEETKAAPAADEVTPESVSKMSPDGVVQVMQNADQLGDPKLMEACCKQLRVLCRQDEMCKRCDEMGTAASVVKAMSVHQQTPGVQQQACAALINLCAGESFARRDHAAEAGALRSIITAMQLHLELAGIQEMAFVALQNICFGSDPNGDARKKKACEDGALVAIVSALKRHSEQSSVIEQGAATLRLLTHKNKLLKAQAMEAGAKTEWLKSTGSITARIGGVTSRMFGSSSPEK